MNRSSVISPLPSPELLDMFCPFSSVPGCPAIGARISKDIFALWEAWEKESGQECPVPFWATTWPAARVLARFLLDHPDLVKGREVLEIGCGGAVASIAAKQAGAGRVRANDIDPIALAIARQNAEWNGVSLQFDSENLIKNRSSGQAQIILLSDFFYTRSASVALAAQLKEWRRRSLIILIGDGGRRFVPEDYREVLREEWVDVDSDLEGKMSRLVRVLRY